MNRENSIFEQMGGTYVQLGGYLLPSLGIAPIEESRSIGKYGLLRKSYLIDHKTGWYQSMLLTGCRATFYKCLRLKEKSR